MTIRKKLTFALGVMAAEPFIMGLLTLTNLPALMWSARAMFFVGTFGLAVYVLRSLGGLNDLVGEIAQGAEQVSSAAQQISSASQSLAQGTSQQAASLEETSASTEEISSITRKNADNAQQVAGLMQ